jgi:hypothetical protein
MVESKDKSYQALDADGLKQLENLHRTDYSAVLFCKMIEESNSAKVKIDSIIQKYLETNNFKNENQICEKIKDKIKTDNNFIESIEKISEKHSRIRNAFTVKSIVKWLIIIVSSTFLSSIIGIITNIFFK